jgi:hypothetical protein
MSWVCTIRHQVFLPSSPSLTYERLRMVTLGIVQYRPKYCQNRFEPWKHGVVFDFSSGSGYHASGAFIFLRAACFIPFLHSAEP